MTLDGTQLSRALFWDVDESALDVDRDGLFIIRRVVDRGALADVKAVWRHYGDERVKTAIVDARCLDERSLAFFANQWRVPRETFRAFSRTRSVS